MITIYHNPNCGTSRNTLTMIRQSGEEPEIIEYLKNPPSRARLIELIKAMNIPVRALLREARVKGSHCEERSDEAIQGSVLQSSSICSWIVSLRSQ
jgi:arsenate reductase (glutaredoxin)